VEILQNRIGTVRIRLHAGDWFMSWTRRVLTKPTRIRRIPDDGLCESVPFAAW